MIYDGTTAHGKAPYTMECRRCGASEVPGIPMSVTVFVAMAKAFGREHRWCRLRATTRASATERSEVPPNDPTGARPRGGENGA